MGFASCLNWQWQEGNQMKRWIILVIGIVALSACTTETAVSPTPTLLPITVVPSATANIPRIDPPVTPLLPAATLPPTAIPSPTPVSPTPEPTITPQPMGFAAIPGNVADGEAAVDFNIHTLSGETIALSDLNSGYVLLLPTIPGCGECLMILNMVDLVYPDYRGQGVQVILLDLYSENDPGYWEFLANLFHEPEFIWGVVGSANFVVEYEITTLGTIILIDPNGNVVYRSEKLIPTDTFRQLFETTVSP
jgi:hypothetical protein